MKSRVIKLDRLVVVKSIFVCLFLLYTLMVIDFTLINDSFGRSISNIFLADKALVNEYLSQKINLPAVYCGNKQRILLLSSVLALVLTPDAQTLLFYDYK